MRLRSFTSLKENEIFEEDKREVVCNRTDLNIELKKSLIYCSVGVRITLQTDGWESFISLLPR